MFGLVASVPEKNPALARRLDELMFPVFRFTEEPAPFFDRVPEEDLVHRACAALLRPDTPIPGDRLLQVLELQDPKPANALRKALQLQLSLLPKLRMDYECHPVPGGHMLGSDLLVPWVAGNGVAECALPDGVWTELAGGQTHEGTFRGIYSLTEQPVLVRPNVIVPVGVSSVTANGDDADRVTLHWFQPDAQADLQLATGEHYHLSIDLNGNVNVDSETKKPWRLIVHRDGEEELIR